ncbi:MAG TPA: helix-turn-helix domain-containing protein [Acidimicrobiales bacterium]|jgi:excisionase family DNA binding protein
MDLITTAQAARRLRVDVSTVWRWVDRGWLDPALRLDNGHMLFDPDEIDHFRPPAAASRPKSA